MSTHIQMSTEGENSRILKRVQLIAKEGIGKSPYFFKPKTIVSAATRLIALYDCTPRQRRVIVEPHLSKCYESLMAHLNPNQM